MTPGHNIFISFLLLLLALPLAGAVHAENITQLTEGVNQASPSVSPDGSRIVYASEQSIRVMNIDGSNDHKLYDSMVWDGEPCFGPDSQTVYFASEHVRPFEASYISIYSIAPDGVQIDQITRNADCRAPAVSPDGKSIAYLSKISGNYDIWVMDINGENAGQITEGDSNEGSPSWSSESLIYSLNGDIWSTGLDNKYPSPLKTDQFENTDPVISPDGSMMAYISDRSGHADLWIMDLDTMGSVQLTDDEFMQSSPAWSVDGKKIIYVSDQAGEFNIWSLDLADKDIPIPEESLTDMIEDKTALNNDLLGSLLSNPLQTAGIAVILALLIIILLIKGFLKGL